MNEDQLAPRVRVMQIIIIALAMGCAAVLFVMYFIRDAQAPAPAMPIMTYVSLAFAAMSVTMRLIIPRMMTAMGRKRLLQFDEPQIVEPLLQLFQTQMIVGAALLEGAVFFLAVSYMIEGNLLCLAVGAALTLAVAVQMPTVGGVASWVTQQQDQIRLERYL